MVDMTGGLYESECVIFTNLSGPSDNSASTLDMSLS